MTKSQTVEAQITSLIRDAAKIKAEEQAHNLSAVAQAVIIRASKAAVPREDGVAHPAQRPRQTGCVRIRFRMNAEAYRIAKERIRASGTSMTAALEEGLERYARTGEF